MEYNKSTFKKQYKKADTMKITYKTKRGNTDGLGLSRISEFPSNTSIMSHQVEKLLLKDFLETRELDSCVHHDLEMALENVMDDNVGASALYHLDNLCYDVFQSIPKVTDERILFRFTSLKADGEKEGKKWAGENCYAFNDIKNGSLSFGAPKLFNDPMDPLIKEWVARRQVHPDDKDDKILYQLIYETLGKIRISCLIDPLRGKWNKRQSPKVTDCNPLMWAHYADGHKGICIQYKIKPVNLIDEKNKLIRLYEVNYDKPFPLDGNIPFLDALCVKGDFWRYENEVRLIMYSRKQLSDYYSQDGYEIEAVYMGCRIEHEKRHYLKGMLKGTAIKLYQMEFSEEDITKLDAHQIY